MALANAEGRAYRVLRVVDREWWRIWWFASCVVFVAAMWRSGSLGRWFVGVAAGLAFLAVLPVLTDHGVRRVRLAAGAWTAVSGAVFTMLLSDLAQGVKGEADVAGAIATALFVAAVAGWIADERMARAADRALDTQRQREQQRHDQLLEAVAAVPARVTARRFWLVAPWLLLGLLLARRRR